MATRPRHEVELAEAFAEVARVLLHEHDVDATLESICELAAKTVDGCQAAGISILEGRKITSRSRTDDIPRIVDEIQTETQEGPCVDAIIEHGVFVTGWLSEERRWPSFSARAHAETGIQSILSLRLYANEETMGALNMYSAETDAFDEQDIAVGSVFAVHAAVALSSAHREADLEHKSASRDIIGMAKGMIMARQHVSEDEAFDILRRGSQRLNVKLRELASRLVRPPPGETQAERLN
jgi:transcriptional regulator with GAF, ATPase, and Fis domain